MTDESMDSRGTRADQMFRPRRRFLTEALGLGAGAAGLAAVGGGEALGQMGGPRVDDAAIVNFALNLEYLEAEYYTYATTGMGLEAAGVRVDGSGTLGAVTVKMNPTVPFATDIIRQYAFEIADDERRHVVFERAALAALGVQPVARPPIDLLNSFHALGNLIGVPDFDPFANETNFLLGAYVFEDVGVTAYHGAARLLRNKDILEAAAGILAVEAYHAGEIRTVLYARGQGAATEAISGVRRSLSTKNDDYGVGPVNGQSRIVLADANAVAFSRNYRQVLNIVYGAVGAPRGLFFPRGMNGVLTN